MVEETPRYFQPGVCAQVKSLFQGCEFSPTDVPQIFPKGVHHPCSGETLPTLSRVPPLAPFYHYPQLNAFSVEEKKEVPQ